MIHLGNGYIVIGSGADKEKIPVEDIFVRGSDMRNQILDKCNEFLEEEDKIHKDKYPEVKRDIFWTNYWDCNFYDEKAVNKCLAYGYPDCNNTRAHNCKYAKMQDMERKEGVLNEIQFRWAKKSKKGVIYFEEGYTRYGRAELNVDKLHFKFIYELFNKHCNITDEYGGKLKRTIISYYEDEW